MNTNLPAQSAGLKSNAQGPKYVRLHFFEARKYMDLLLKDARDNVREALLWKERNYGGKGAEGYADYLSWAKHSADDARVIARKLRIHFGKEAVSVRLARHEEYTREMARLNAILAERKVAA